MHLDTLSMKTPYNDSPSVRPHTTIHLFDKRKVDVQTFALWDTLSVRSGRIFMRLMAGQKSAGLCAVHACRDDRRSRCFCNPSRRVRI